MLLAQNRLHRQKDFKLMYKTSHFLANQSLIIRYRKNGLLVSRFAVIVDNKVSKKAVIRNKLKRRVREILRKNLSKIPASFDFSVNLKKSALDLTYPQLQAQVLKLFLKIKS